MTKIAVVVVEAETPGNIGTIARAMKNFGFTKLVLIDPPPLDINGEAYGFAGHARTDILPNHERATFEQIVSNYHTIGFTATTNESAAKHVRYPFTTPAQLATHISEIDTEIALIFGRESTGLRNTELAQIDQICSIPASASYPVLNLGQAATIVLYELRDIMLKETQHPDRLELASPSEIEAFHEHFDEFLTILHYPTEKHDKTVRLVRRLLGRAYPTERELITLRGILRRASRANQDSIPLEPSATDSTPNCTNLGVEKDEP